MTSTQNYVSPIGMLTMAAREGYLVGLWFENQKHFGSTLQPSKNAHVIRCFENQQTTIDIEVGREHDDLSVETADSLTANAQTLELTKQWLDAYFAHRPLPNTPPLQLTGTAFRLNVWLKLLKIPYGQCTTYGQIADMLSPKTGKKNMFSRAVGNAIGHNPISIVVPCHRVLGGRQQLTGYAGGIDKKQFLLTWEQHKM